MDIGEAVRHLKIGYWVKRESWGGTAQHLYLAGGLACIHPGNGPDTLWACTSGSLMADDFVVVQKPATN